MLSELEHNALKMTVDLHNVLTLIVGHGPFRETDMRELTFYIHGIQRAILSQAAARQFPAMYRLLGNPPVI